MHGRLMLTVLGGLAEFERELILARTGAGRAHAKARGVKFGRPYVMTPDQRQEAIQRLAEGATQAIWRGPIVCHRQRSQGLAERCEPRTTTPHLLAFGASRQFSAYLLVADT
jgi:DNA invertase Pin-like site-specific DNA recombinase